MMLARKTAPLVDELKAATWKRSPGADAGARCEFSCQPEEWGEAYRFLALRYLKEPEVEATDRPEQYRLFDTPEYTCRVFVTNMSDPLAYLVWFYNQRAGAENLLKEANNDARLAAPPVQALDDERQLVPVRDVGPQPELLAATVQPRGGRPGRADAAHHLGGGALAVFVFGGQVLAACRARGRQLQRPLQGENGV
jgi:hypothetical protein